MQPKKSPRADLQNKRLLFFETGLVTALLAVALVFSRGSDAPAPTAALRAVQADEPGETVWTDLPSLEVRTGDRPRIKVAPPPLPSRIEIVKNDLKIEPPAALTADETDTAEGLGGDLPTIGYPGNGAGRTTPPPKAGTPGEKNTDYLFISFVPDPNPSRTLDGIIIIPYTIGEKIDTGKLERYTGSVERFVRKALHRKYKPLITELPPDYFAADPIGASPAVLVAENRSADTTLSVKTLLTRHEWTANLAGSEYCRIRLNYKSKTEVKTVIVGNKRYSGQTFRNYYLSNRAETHFDPKRVGKSDSGRFIVTETFSGIPEVTEILEISDSTLIIRLLPDRLPVKYRRLRGRSS